MQLTKTDRTGSDPDERALDIPPPIAGKKPKALAERGQVLALFVLSIFVVTGFVALVVDVSWYWSSSLRVQRAADAAALAGAIDLPAKPGTSVSHPLGTGIGDALAQAAKNGYTDGVDGVTVTPVQDPKNDNRISVTISAPVGTFFMRIFGINSIAATRTAKAEFILPVPMGSPENYYGIYCNTTASDKTCAQASSLVPDARGSGTLPSKGFWGAAITKGGNQQNGDAFLPANNGGYSPANNASYDPSGYAYTVVVPAGGGGSVWVYDPTFCAVGGNGNNGYYGTGDHWIDGPTNAVSTYFNLYTTNNTPYDLTDDTLVAGSGSLFEAEDRSDHSAALGSSTAASTDCAAGKITDQSNGGYWHNKWWPMVTPGSLAAGTYRLQVTTTKVTTNSDGGTQAVAGWTANDNTNAENMWGIEVGSSGMKPRVYGSGRMAAYNTLIAGTQEFYLAQIEAKNAGKSIEIDLFDPGDVKGDATLSVLGPDGTAATFDYSTFDPNNSSGGSNCVANNSDLCSAQGRTSIMTSKGGSSSFNNTWIQILVKLDATYNPAAGSDWWKIRYVVGQGNDTTTWMVNIRGNPVHLVVP